MPYDGLSLVGQTAFVTGSGRGIGAALAVGLAQAGATVAVSDRPDRLDLAKETRAKVEAEGVKSAVYPLDVLDLPNNPKAIEQFQKAQNLFPAGGSTQGALLYDLGIAFESIGRYEDALRAYEDSVAISDNLDKQDAIERAREQIRRKKGKVSGI